MGSYQHTTKQNDAQSAQHHTPPTVIPQPPQVQQQSVEAKSNEEGLAEHAERLRKFQRLGNSMIQMGPPRPCNDKTSSLQPKPWIQRKLTLGQPGDKYEQEADRIASQVVQQINAPASKENTLWQSIQREKDLEGEMQARCFKAAIQRKQAIAGGEVSPDLESAINSARGSGQPLDAGLQKSMSQTMGADFSGVRVHTDAQSDQLNQSIQAKAFTTGQDVFFREGAYQPRSRGGQELIAHELTHVVQQNGGSVMGSHLLSRTWHRNQLKQAFVESEVQEKSLGQKANIQTSKMMEVPCARTERSQYEGATAISYEPDIQPIPSSIQIQAKMGIELETDNQFRVKKGKNSWRAPRRKEVVYLDQQAGFQLEADTESNFEFVFHPQEEKVKLVEAVESAVEVAEHLNDNPIKTKGGKWQEDFEANVKGVKWRNIKGVKWRNWDNEWEADGQVTEGVALSDIVPYMEDILYSEHNEDKDLSSEIEATEDIVGEQQGQTDAVRGLLQVLMYYTRIFSDWKGKDNEEGPKNAVIFMQRTDFAAMYQSLSNHEQDYFKSLFFTNQLQWIAENPISEQTDVAGDDPVIPNAYIGDKGGKGKFKEMQNPLTLEGWIKSILSEGKDEMSPPAGWRSGKNDKHLTQQELDEMPGAYGMGKMGMDTSSVPNTPLALFEWRMTDSSTNYDYTGKGLSMFVWSAWVEEVFDNAMERNSTLKDTMKSKEKIEEEQLAWQQAWEEYMAQRDDDI